MYLSIYYEHLTKTRHENSTALRYREIGVDVCMCMHPLYTYTYILLQGIISIFDLNITYMYVGIFFCSQRRKMQAERATIFSKKYIIQFLKVGGVGDSFFMCSGYPQKPYLISQCWDLKIKNKVNGTIFLNCRLFPFFFLAVVALRKTSWSCSTAT